MGWARLYSAQSISNDRELGSAIYKKKINGKTWFSFTQPLESDDPNSRKLWKPETWFGKINSMVPKDAVMVGKIHSHGAYDPDYNGGLNGADQNNFSPPDEDAMNRNEPANNDQDNSNDVDYYLVNPDGNMNVMRYHNPISKALCDGCVASDPNPRKDKPKQPFRRLPYNVHWDSFDDPSAKDLNPYIFLTIPPDINPEKRGIHVTPSNNEKSIKYDQ